MASQWAGIEEQWRQVAAARGRAKKAADEALRRAPALLKAGAFAQQGAMQLDTAVRGAANVLTFGAADRIAAGTDALMEAAGGADWEASFRSNLKHQQGRSALDAARRPVALGIGNAAGAIIGVTAAAARAPAGMVAALAPRLAGAAPLSLREAAAIVAGGGAAGLGVQIGLETMQGRISSPGDQIGAALGGAIGAAALPAGPVRAGAIGAATTTAAQDLLSRRAPSIERAGQAAVLGGMLGRFADGVAQSSSTRLSTARKGQLGEFLGNIRSVVNGEPRPLVGPRPKYAVEEISEAKNKKIVAKMRDYIAGTGKYWYPDGVSRRGIRFEDKFGYGAELTPNQKLARAALGDKFVLYHMLPSDLGKAAAVPAGQAAAPLISEARP